MDTMRIARDLVTALERAPSAVLLYGDLGAGKTAFVRGLVEGAGGCPDEVSSPTFVLMQEYPGRRLVHHVDLYRLGGEDVADLEPLLDEMLAGDAIVAIEWADRLRSLPETAVRVRITDLGGDDREITVDGPVQP
jgi:tRNA threonylcarbamoyladenosine biosynthesis protein TsaE